MFTLLHLGESGLSDNVTDLNHLVEGGDAIDDSIRVARHPALCCSVRVVAGEVFGFDGLSDWSSGDRQWIPGWPFHNNNFSHPISPVFDQPGDRGTQWIDGDYDVPPQSILDVAAGTRFQVGIVIETPWGTHRDNFTIERGQSRVRADILDEENNDMVLVPDVLSRLDTQATYYGPEIPARRHPGDPGYEPAEEVRLHQFRHPSWSLLCQQNNAAYRFGGFNFTVPDQGEDPEDSFAYDKWDIGGTISEVFQNGSVELEEASSVLVIDELGGDPFPFVMRFSGHDRRQELSANWSVGDFLPAHSNDGYKNHGRGAWRSSLFAEVVGAEYSDLEWINSGDLQAYFLTPEEVETVTAEAEAFIVEFLRVHPLDLRLWLCTPVIYGRDTATDEDYQDLITNDTIAESEAMPFSTPPVFSFKATAFVKDFLDFEFK